MMAKKTIMLVCSAGMSTSLLVTKMQKAAEAQGVDADIFAVSASDADNNLEAKPVDVLLLGPQVRFMKGDFEKRMAGKNHKRHPYQRVSFFVLEKRLKYVSP